MSVLTGTLTNTCRYTIGTVVVKFSFYDDAGKVLVKENTAGTFVKRSLSPFSTYPVKAYIDEDVRTHQIESYKITSVRELVYR